MPTTEVSLALREVRGSDAELLHLSALLATMDGEAPLPLATMRERYATMRRYPDYRCYMMVGPDEVPLGTFSLLVFSVMVHDGRPEAIVEAVVVAPAARGMGIGKAMMREAMRLAREAGAAKLALSSSARRLRAHHFYRQLGFTEHGISFSIEL
ncbi:Phosphonates transport system; putative Acetyltransferase; GCN5-related N-acetyltransferase domain [Cupriavidus phytorum]|uniref:Acetyltransferase (GNAT) family protein n=2 Tax=Cupriavidus TaxID=106589 RepID=A0A2W7NYS2_9BURK|nr:MULTISPECIES: GNAT family N-acetyltransferase [Cupriavidus]PZX22062.1 acetyltransferase (GNAT) family protein [Cupriavidus alkaliphilus]SOY76521.1 Phosphonates transport system; putative Acetyltransferase; GCN5-related N-acetyltransferase domain [Cupriavidus taiwanensis]